jgi:hypothetical protein
MQHISCKLFRLLLIPIGVALGAFPSMAWPSDACATGTINATAAVSVSDGENFTIDSYFQSPDTAAIRHVRDETQIVVVEGPFGWASRGDQAELGGNFFRAFALGHQFHALLLYFDDIVPDAQRSDGVPFDGDLRQAVSGTYPYGGVVRLVASDTEERPLGMLLEFPETAPIAIRYSDWRTIDGIDLPFLLQVDDGERVFDYVYTDIDIAPHSPLAFSAAVGTPDIDQIELYRLHRTLLAAHCVGDARLIASLSAPEIIDVSGGTVRTFSNAELQELFTTVFARLRYDRYDDVAFPVIEIAEGSDMAWIAADVLAVATDKQTEETFESKWAWVMMARKVDGTWLHVGTASNRAN